MDNVYRNVEDASQLMRRYYRTTRETMRAMAGYFPKMKNWQAKKFLAKHIWMDATHADTLRSRVFDLRYPKVDADDQVDINIIRFFERLPNTNDDETFLIAIYKVIKPSLLKSYKNYLKESDSLDDAPSHIYLERIIFEMEKELNEFENTFTKYFDADEKKIVTDSTYYLNLLNDCGGIVGPDKKPDHNYSYFSQKNYTIPLIPGRDPSWKKAKTQVPPRTPKNVLEQRIWVAIDHVNELWASETVASLIWHYKNMPWELYLNAARWCYDEIRHSMMGEQRLSDLGLEIGVDYPMAHDNWLAFREQGIDKLLFLLHGVEQKGPLHKSHLRDELLKAEDIDSAQDCDYDWADEAGHIRFGLQWIKAVYPDWSKKEIMNETQETVSQWTQWVEEHQADGKHGYNEFLNSIEKNVKRTEQKEQKLLNLSPTHIVK